MKLHSKKDSYTIEKEIDRCLNEMKKFHVESDEYRKAAANLKALYEANANKPHNVISPETIALVAANLTGIVLVLYFERTGSVISKAFGMIGRGSK